MVIADTWPLRQVILTTSVFGLLWSESEDALSNLCHLSIARSLIKSLRKSQRNWKRSHDIPNLGRDSWFSHKMAEQIISIAINIINIHTYVCQSIRSQKVSLRSGTSLNARVCCLPHVVAAKERLRLASSSLLLAWRKYCTNTRQKYSTSWPK